MADDGSPTARAIRALELIQNTPGITAERLGQRLGVSDRAARRYVGILREAGLPIESTPGRYGGYRVGRGLRLPPLMFSTAEAIGLVMAVLERRPTASDGDPVDSALGKIIRVLPVPVAEPARAIRQMSCGAVDTVAAVPSPETTAVLVQACASGRRIRVEYALGRHEIRPMELDPWAVSVRHGRWYLLCWSHTRDARRLLRVDRIVSLDVLTDTFEPPTGLDPARAVDEHLADGWQYPVEVVIDAPVAVVAECMPRGLGRIEPIDIGHTRLTATTDEPDWYAAQLVRIEAPFHIIGPDALRKSTAMLAQRFSTAASPPGPADAG